MRKSVCVCALDEQNAEEELSAEKRHSIQHTLSLKEQFVQVLILEIVQ